MQLQPSQCSHILTSTYIVVYPVSLHNGPEGFQEEILQTCTVKSTILWYRPKALVGERVSRQLLGPELQSRLRATQPFWVELTKVTRVTVVAALNLPGGSLLSLRSETSELQLCIK